MMDRNEFRTAIQQNALVYASNTTQIIGSGGIESKWLFDFRAILLTPAWLDAFATLFWDQYSTRYPFQVGSMETAGIALVAAIVTKSVQLGKPINGFYIRKSRKKDGLMKAIEGTCTSDPIILVDDLINSGSTFKKQLLVLDDVGAKVTDIFTVVRFREPQTYAFAHERGVHLTSIFDLTDFGIPLLKPVVADIPTFSIRWRYKAPKPSFHIVAEKSAPMLHNKLVLFGCDDGVLRALDTETGVLRWEFRIGPHRGGKGILSNPIIHRDTVFFGGYDGNVYALDVNTGTKRWSFEDADWVGSSPAIDVARDRLYIGLEFGLFGKKGAVVALDMKSGSEVWRNTTREFTHATPLYIPEEDLVVIGSNDHVVRAYDAEGGALRWQFQTRGDIKSAPVYHPQKRLIAVNSMDGSCYVLHARDGTPFFAKETEFGLYSSPLIVADTLYIASLDKTITAIDITNTTVRWFYTTHGRIFSSPSFFDNSIWIGSNDGVLYELHPETGALKGRFQASERIVNAPVFDATTGRIYVATQINELYCLERDKKVVPDDYASGTRLDETTGED